MGGICGMPRKRKRGLSAGCRRKRRVELSTKRGFRKVDPTRQIPEQFFVTPPERPKKKEGE